MSTLSYLPSEEGQSTVEFALLIPVMIVVGLILYNLGVFLYYAASFEQVAQDMILAHAVSFTVAENSSSPEEAVQQQLAAYFSDAPRCSIEVTKNAVDTEISSDRIVLSPYLERFVCVLEYRPWPGHVKLPFLEMVAPVFLRKEVSLVVDRFRPGVVM